MPPLISFAQYAKQRGVSRAAVTYAVQAGRISTVIDPVSGQRRIDPRIADQEWGRNTDADMRRNGLGTHSRGLGEEEKNTTDRTQEKSQESQISTGGKLPSLAESRSIKEAFLARLAKIEYEERSGKLVEVEKVKVEAYKIARVVRDAILAVPDRIDAELAVISDRAQINRVLKTELMRALEDLAHGK